MTKCLGPHHELDDFTTYDFATYDLTTFTTSRLQTGIDLETLPLCDFSSFLHCKSLKSRNVSKFLDRLQVVKSSKS
jgi:hypothetical protein